MRLNPDEYLLRWVNYHLKNAKYEKQITNFAADLKVKIDFPQRFCESTAIENSFRNFQLLLIHKIVVENQKIPRINGRKLS